MLNSIPTMVDLRSRYCRYILAQGWPLNILMWCSVEFGFAASPLWCQPPFFAALKAPETSRTFECRTSGAAIKSRRREFKPPLRSLPASAVQYLKAAARFVSILTIRLSVSNALLIVISLGVSARAQHLSGAAIHLDCWTAAFAILRRRAQLNCRRFGRTWLLTATLTITGRQRELYSSFGRSGIQIN